jgi:hypothetical protein
MKQEAVQKVRLHNRFDIEVRDARTGELKQRAQAENIILSNLWAQLIGGTNFFTNIAYGTGTGVLSAARTTLFTHLGYKAAASGVLVDNLKDEGWASYRQAIVLSEIEHVGSILSEVGIGSNTIYTHALLKDMNGNTTTIEKTNLDIITIYATVYARLDPDMWYSGQLRAMFSLMKELPAAGIISNMLGVGGALTANAYLVFSGGKTPALAVDNFYSGSHFLATHYDYGARALIAATITNDVANKKKSWFARCPVDSGNSAYGIGSVGLLLYTYYADYHSMSALQAYCSLPFSEFTGDSIVGETIGVGDGSETDFATDFPLVKAGATVYIDGIEVVSGVTVHTGKPHTNVITSLMRQLFIHSTTQWNAYDVPPMVGATVTGGSWAAGECIFENTKYATVPIESALFGLNCRLYSSDDLETWTLAATSASSTVNTDIPAGHQSKQYWKLAGRASDNILIGGIYNFLNADYASFKNVIFDTAPAEGEVVTIDYDTEICAKDVNHVFDFTFTLQFAEYTP